MPPSCGKRDASSVTTSPCGTKNKSPASIQSAIALGPAFAAVESHRRPTTATRLKRTRARSPSARLRVPSSAGSFISQPEQVRCLHEERIVRPIVAVEAKARRKLERLRRHSRVRIARAVAEEDHRAGVGQEGEE